MPRARINPPGLGKKMAIGGLQSGLGSLYQELTGGKGSFRNDIAERVNGYEVHDKELGVDGTIRDVARGHGLERELDAYISQKVIGGIKGNLARLLDWTTSIKDGLEDVVEGAELAGTAAGAATGGTGSVVVQIGGNAIQVPIYIAAQAAYTILAGILGYASGTYTLTGKGLANYLADSTKGFIGAVGSTIPVLGSLLELGTNLDNKRGRIAESASKRTEAWLLSRIRKQKGLRPMQEEPNLESLVRKGIGEVRSQPSAGTQAGAPGLEEYGHGNVVPLRPVYGSDLSRTPYATERRAA